jgi:hypothetical protein
MSISLPNVGSSAQIASNNTKNPSSSDCPKSMKDGRALHYFEPLEKKTQKSYEKSRMF